MKKCLFFAVIIIVLVSCQKEEISPVMDEVSSVDYSNDSLVEPINLKITSSSILNATSANQIPSQMFTTYTRYKNSYQHMKQRPMSVSGYGECSWTSYVIAAACIIKGNCSPCSYPVSNAKVADVKATCVQHANGSIPNGALITNLKWYCNTYDSQRLICTTEAKTTSERFIAIKLMLSHLNTYHTPFLVISTSGGYGHYLIVHAINWKVGGTGSTIYYTDCTNIASNTTYISNIKTMNFTTFLNNMVDVPNKYNMLFFQPN